MEHSHANTTFSVLLFTLTVTQQWHYWTTYTKDVWWIRAIAISMFATDFLAVAALCAMAYLVGPMPLASIAVILTLIDCSM